MFVKAFVEVAKGSNHKYEMDMKSGALVLDRVLPEGIIYPQNYGFIPNTLSGDGDPLDVFIISKNPLLPGCFVNIDIQGYLNTTDEKGHDPKIVATIKGERSVCLYSISSLVTFMYKYKKAEGKFIQVGNSYGKSHAIDIINEAICRAT